MDHDYVKEHNISQLRSTTTLTTEMFRLEEWNTVPNYVYMVLIHLREM